VAVAAGEAVAIELAPVEERRSCHKRANFGSKPHAARPALRGPATVGEMARIARRISTLGGRYFHVTTGGVEQRLIFLDDDDRRLFVRLLREVAARHGWRLHAYCLMGNHVRLVVETTPEELSRGMHRLLFRYAQRFNLRYDRKGHLFAGRFTSRVIRNLRDLVNACIYVIWSPVRAGRCAVPQHWPWSGGRIMPRPAAARAGPSSAAWST
jgi:REP element-mobilizing transposase RayT